MPYIEKERRKKFNAIAIKLSEMLAYNGLSGNLNYFLNKLFIEYFIYVYNEAEARSFYREIKDFLSELHEAECEIRRRHLVAYEDKKIKQHGEIT
jgi:CRISPR/Cas system CMR-associated protein Cmr5 small subunit